MQNLKIALYVGLPSSPEYLKLELSKGVTDFTANHENVESVLYAGTPIVDDNSIDIIKADAYICFCHNESLERLRENTLPYVNLSGSTNGTNQKTYIDDLSVGNEAAKYLLGLGLNHFCYLTPTESHYSRNRYKGFKRELELNGMTCHYLCREIWKHEKPTQDVIEFIKKLPKPLGILTCEDHYGRGAIQITQHAGFNVPDDVAILGIDGNPYNCLCSKPTLSSIPLNFRHLAYEATKLLFEQMHGIDTKSREPVVILPLPVDERESTDIMHYDNPLISQIIAYIRRNACSEVYVDQITDKFPCSRRWLDGRFKEITGVTTSTYINKIQLAQAQKMLIQTSYTVEEISSFTGFSDSQHLIRVFRKHLHTTPGEFRKRERGR